MLKKRGGIWWADFYSAGKRVRKSTKTDNIKKARIVESQWVGKAEAGEDCGLRKKAPLLRDFLPKFTAYTESRIDIEKKTKAYYASGVKLIEASSLPSMYMEQIKPVVLQSVSFGGSASNENMGRRTLSKIFGYARDLGVVRESLKVPKLKQIGRDILIDKPTELRVLDLNIQPLSDVLMFSKDAGMRPGEIVRMRVEHVRMELSHYRNPFGKTKQAARACLISDRMVPRLKALIAGRTEGWLFVGRRKNKHISLSFVEHQWSDIRTGLGLPSNMVLYCARHTWATENAPHVSGAELQQAGGWADARIASVYQHPGLDRLMAAVNKRNELPN